jgi:6-phosphogluconolactonase (cycloisomerase 2 family)
MLISQYTILSALSAAASATDLFVSSYAGDVTTLSLGHTNGSYSLNATSSSSECGPNPAWLTLDASRDTLYCLNEGLATPNGSLSSFTINCDGSLKHVQNTTTPNGPVSGVIYGHPGGDRGIALAHYGGSALSTYSLASGGRFDGNDSFAFSMPGPGAVPDRQASPHPHEAVLDPTGQYIIVPDLGADLIRVFAINPKTQALTAKASFKTPAGSGPRHAAFHNPYGVTGEGATTYLYVVTELTSTIISYSVSYVPKQGGLTFTAVQEVPALGQLSHSRINAPAGIALSPDNRFLLLSNRNSSIFTLPNPDAKNSTAVSSDSITTFSLSTSGKLGFVQAWPTYGLFPRHFSLNSAGNLLAVGNQNSANVVVLKRDVATGLIGDVLAEAEVEGMVTSVVFRQVGAVNGA